MSETIRDIKREHANLTGAAPALYAALSDIRHNWGGHADQCASVLSRGKKRCDCDWPKIAARCDAALAKARGDTP
jgi:hypothetical protein